MNIKDTNTGKSIDKQNSLKRFWGKFAIGAKKAGQIIVGRTIPQKLFRLYILIVIAGALLLCAPFCLRVVEINGHKIQANGFTNATGNYGFIQALFIACSGFSDTGLTPVNIYEYLNEGGQVVLMILIEVGGIGVIALFYYVWNFFKKKEDKIDVGQLYVMQAERGGSKLSESFQVIKSALIFILLTQVVFMFIYAICFTCLPSYVQQFKYDAEGRGISFNSTTSLGLQGNFGKSLWVGLFTTVSAMNNAGFDNISSTSMAPFRNNWGVVFQAFIVLELIIGGLGHFVWFDVIEKIKCKATHKKYKMTLYSKVAISVYFIVAAIGLASAFACEFTDPAVTGALKEYTIVGNSSSNGEFGDQNKPGQVMFNKCFVIIFNVFNCRSLGMETIKTDYFVEGSKWVFAILMFIGASPCSTAGGIRTTTLAVIFVTIWCKLLGRKNVFFFKRRISDDTVVQSFMIFIIALLILIIGCGVVYSSIPKTSEIGMVNRGNVTVGELMVECCSAFGTVGLSTGITAVARWWGLLYLVLLMFVGQLGIINTLLSWTKFHPHFNDIEYPYEDIKIG